MNELVNLVSQRTGLSPQQAQQAVEAVLQILKQRLPAPLAGHIDSLLSGGGLGGLEAEAGEMLKGKLGGMFGGN